MRIVIVGCGKVGTFLIEQLSAEKHDIIVIDKDKAVIERMTNAYDVMCVYGNGASRIAQTEAEVKKADLLIASTDYDELNMLCCITAKKLGAKNTIARIRNPEYNDQLSFLRDELGLSMHINPEYAAASEIFKILRFPSAQKIETFADGRVELVEIKISEEMPINGAKLRDLTGILKVKILICAVQRGEEVFIPSGEFALQSGDTLSITASPNEVQKLFREWGILRKKVGSVMIIGGNRIGFYLSRMLLEAGMRVKIIDKDEKQCQFLCEQLPKAMIICGNGTNQELLHSEGIDEVGALVSLTGLDEENLIISMYANSIGVSKIIAKVNRTELVPLVQSVGLDTIVSPKKIAANSIIRYVRAMSSIRGNKMETLHRVVGGKVEAIEFVIKDAPGITDIPLKLLKTKENLLIASIIRGGRTIIPGGEDMIKRGDRVVIVTTNQYLSNLADILA